jgi:hypothetical protein
MENKVDPHRWGKVEFIADVFDISFDFKWTEFFVIELVTRPCYFDVSS